MENLVFLATIIIIMVGLRVPYAIGKFNSYIVRVAAFLAAEDPVTHTTNGARLGMTTSELTQLAAFLTLWTDAFLLHNDPKTKTKVTRVTVLTIIKNFRIFFSPILNRINASANCTNEDRTELNIAIRKPYSKKKVKIKDKVYEIAIQLGGGEIEIMCRTTKDSKRGKINPDADGWFIAYDVVDPKMDNPDLHPKVKKVAPESPDECFNSSSHTRAKDVLDVGAENIGRELVYFVKWYNHRNPALSGPYGPAKTIIIL